MKKTYRMLWDNNPIRGRMGVELPDKSIILLTEYGMHFALPRKKFKPIFAKQKSRYYEFVVTMDELEMFEKAMDFSEQKFRGMVKGEKR